MLSIIIVSYNTKELLGQCIENIDAIDIAISYEIIVVDNASADGSTQLVETLDTEVLLIKNSENRLFAPACQQGAEIAQGEYLLFLNSDAFPGKGQLEILTGALKEGEERLACVGPSVVSAQGVMQTEGRPFPSISLTLANVLAIIKWPVPDSVKRHLLPGGYHRFMYGIERDVDWLSGCCMLIKKSVWAKIGPFDEKLYFYNEDREWCYRARRSGFKTRVIPAAKVVHLGGASSREPASLQKRMGLLSGEKYFYRCTQGFAYHLTNQVLILILYPLPWLVCKLVGLRFYEQASKREMRKAINTIKIILNKNI